MSNDLNYDEIDDLFAGGGAPAASFAELGDSITGVILNVEGRQQTDFDSGEPLTWDDGKPRMEAIITLSTKLRDPEVEDDEGERRLFCRGQMLTAMRGAVKKAKDKKPRIGGRLTVTFSDEGEQKKKGFNKPKLFTVVYEPPNDVAVENLFDEADEPAEEAKPAAKPAKAEVSEQEAAIEAIKNMDPAELAALLASR
jgi:hypothetical protein